MSKQKKVAVINDIAGYGRCALSVAMPIISALKVQCCPLPTSIFSNHSGYKSFFYEDFTDNMQPYIEEWKKIGMEFDCIGSGFLGSEKQINIVAEFFEQFKKEKTIILVDPIMGDNGKVYKTYTQKLCRRMKELVAYADIITPNLTESCILTDTGYHEGRWHIHEIDEMASKLLTMGPEKIVITGIPQGEFVANFCYEKNKPLQICRTQRIGTQRFGTGDIFASILLADAANGVEFSKSVKKASGFIKKCILKSIELDIPLTDGVCFEAVLHTLKAD